MGHDDSDGTLVIDCATCSVRGTGCADCVVTALLDLGDLGPGDFSAPHGSSAELALDPEEAKALEVLASGGLLPPLRHTAQTG